MTQGRSSWQISLSSENFLKPATGMWTSLILWSGGRVSGSAKQKWSLWLVTLVWREWWLQPMWSVAVSDPEMST